MAQPLDETFYGAYNAQNLRNQQASAANMQQSIGTIGMLQKIQAMQEQNKVKEILATSPDEATAMTRLQKEGGMLGIQVAQHIGNLKKQKMDAAQQEREQAPFTAENLNRLTTPGLPAIAPRPTEEVLPPDVAGPPAPATEGRAAVPPQINLDALRQQAAMTGPKGMEAYSLHKATEATKNQTLAIQLMGLQQKATEADQRSQDRALDRQARADAQAEARNLRREMMTLAASMRQPSPPVSVVGPDGRPVLVSREDAIGKTPTTAALDAKAQAAVAQDTSALQSMTADLDRLAAEANALKEHPGLQRATGGMSIVPVVGGTLTMPGTDPANFKERLGTLKSQVAFGVLQNMRNNSKSGGALGQVSDKEGQLLQDNLAALGRAQSAKEFSAALGRIIDYTNKAKDRLREAYNAKHGDKASAAPKEDPLGIR